MMSTATKMWVITRRSSNARLLIGVGHGPGVPKDTAHAGSRVLGWDAISIGGPGSRDPWPGRPACSGGGPGGPPPAAEPPATARPPLPHPTFRGRFGPPLRPDRTVG